MTGPIRIFYSGKSFICTETMEQQKLVGYVDYIDAARSAVQSELDGILFIKRRLCSTLERL